MKQQHRAELLVGIFLFIGLIVLGGVIVRFGSFKEHFRERYPLTVSFPDAGGIVDGSDVRLGGAKIGRVARAPYLKEDASGVIVELEIYKEFRIPENSEFQVGMSGLLGDGFVSVLQPDELTGNYIEAGTTIEGRKGILSNLANTAEDFSKKGQAMLDEVRGALKDLNSAIGKFDSSILREENLKRFDGAMVQLSEALGKLNAEVLSDENSKEFKTTLSNLRMTSEKLLALSEKAGEGVESFTSAAAKADSTFGKADVALDKLSGALDDATEGDGVVAAMLNDAEMRADLEALIRNLRQHGVLRYKDPDGEKEDGSGSGRDRGRFDWMKKR